MIYDEQNLSGAAPVRARSKDAMEHASDEQRPTEPEQPSAEPPLMESLGPEPQNGHGGSFPFNHSPEAHRFHAEISDDLDVPWGWMEVLLLVILAVIGSAVVTWGAAQVAVRFFGIPANEVFGDTMSTAKSVVVLVSQAMLDGLAILYLYLMLQARTTAPFWPSIGWREMRPGLGKIRDSAFHYLAVGAMLAVVVSFVGGFLNSKETLPIEELLKARVSILLFGVLGVLVAPLVEETIFRGFLYPVIARRLGVVGGVAITGTLFGLMHAAQLWGGWGQIALLILVGVILTWVRARTGTVAASYFVHLGYNGLQLVGYLIYVVSGSHH
ncbi:MAG TPA: type II CAAX endopeptidase family protein [Candidatus Saccharimonadales bacterium]|jgi:membrane protease YdiL (CAAX protease family)|nr:type II CAAX endopeptidase family protein [Candidatus Saccharimonadales bacterium]